MKVRPAGRSREGGAAEAGRRRRQWLAAGVLAALTALVSAPGARGQRPSQDEVEAAYLYNFGKFVRWPETEGQGPLRICVAGSSTFEQTVNRLVAGAQIGDRLVEVREAERPEDTAGCSILFVGAMEEAREDAFLGATSGKPVLTVGEARDFLSRGGMIEFVPVEDHVRFAVNLDAANRSGVGLSSELLKVAVSVTGKPGKGGAR